MDRGDWGVLQHSLPPHVPMEKLRKESGGDLKTFIASLADLVFAFVQRREAVQLVKVSYNLFVVLYHFLVTLCNLKNFNINPKTCPCNMNIL